MFPIRFQISPHKHGVSSAVPVPRVSRKESTFPPPSCLPFFQVILFFEFVVVLPRVKIKVPVLRSVGRYSSSRSVEGMSTMVLLPY